MSGRWMSGLAATCLLAGLGVAQGVNSGGLFDRLDANKDGVITRDELPARAQRRLDRSGASSLTREDFERFRARRLQARQQRGELTQEQRQLRADRFGALREFRLTHPEVSRQLREMRRERLERRMRRHPALERQPNQPLRSI
jgi:hypothetical protein